MTTDPIKNAIESRLKDAYASRRRQIHPGYCPINPWNEKDWGRAAQMVQELNASPEIFIEAQFSANAICQPKFPYPNMLYSEKAAENFKKFSAGGGFSAETLTKPEAIIQVEMNSLTPHLKDSSNQFDIDKVLASSILTFKSWFRILMVSDINLSTFMKVWGPTAIRQMKNVPHLRKFLDNSDFASRTNRFDCPETSVENPSQPPDVSLPNSPPPCHTPPPTYRKVPNWDHS
jgi:hypothetical protein